MQASRRVAAPALQRSLPTSRQTKLSLICFSSFFVILSLFVHVFVLLPSTTAMAAESDSSSAAAVAFDSKVRAIGSKLRCPVCEGQSIAESHSEVAIEMRQEVMRRLMAGESEEEILNAFVEVWGPSILTAPPRQGGYLLAWIAPVLLLFVGVWLLWRFVGRPITVENGTAAIDDDAVPAYKGGTLSADDAKLKQRVEEQLRKYL